MKFTPLPRGKKSVRVFHAIGSVEHDDMMLTDHPYENPLSELVVEAAEVAPATGTVGIGNKLSRG